MKKKRLLGDKFLSQYVLQLIKKNGLQIEAVKKISNSDHKKLISQI